MSGSHRLVHFRTSSRERNMQACCVGAWLAPKTAISPLFIPNQGIPSIHASRIRARGGSIEGFVKGHCTNRLVVIRLGIQKNRQSMLANNDATRPQGGGVLQPNGEAGRCKARETNDGDDFAPSFLSHQALPFLFRPGHHPYLLLSCKRQNVRGRKQQGCGGASYRKRNKSWVR